MKVKKICEQCREEFEAEIYPRSGGKTRTTCSKECRYKLMSSKTRKHDKEKIKKVLEKTRSIKKAAKLLNMSVVALASFNCKYLKVDCRFFKKGRTPWNKRSKDGLNEIKLTLEKTLSHKDTAKILGMTTSTINTINSKYLKIDCRPGCNKYPKWTEEEDKFAIKYLKKNPDLKKLAKIIAEKRGIVYTEKFQYAVRDRSAKAWKLNLKKLRANKGLNENLFKKGLRPWNKGKTKHTDERVMKISKGLTGRKHSLETLRKLGDIAKEKMKNPEFRKIVSKFWFKKGEINPYSVAIFITKRCLICRKFRRVPLSRANSKYHKRCFYESDEFKKAQDKNKTIEYRKIVSERYDDPNFLYKWYKGILFKNIPESQLTNLDKKVIEANILIHKIRRLLKCQQVKS